MADSSMWFDLSLHPRRRSIDVADNYTLVMRNRSNSGLRLDYYQRLVNRSILKYQNAATGLLSASETNSHAWVRDNLYCIMSVWGLALAYRKTADLDEDRAKAYELEQSVVKAMRGLLRSMMMQVDKLEAFKHTQNPRDSLHAKYCSITGKPVVGDLEWGHLQVDATSLYLLTLAQITASGLQVVYTLDEVAFIQNLVFYIESAYRTPDYGVWERGDKTNHGLPELNSSSIGMAKSALDAINGLDLFGALGGPASIIHVLPDEAQQCQAILHSMLPRESNSKEVDAGLIAIIGFPAFAVDDVEIIEDTRSTIVKKLEGKYGCCRFLRDGYKTVKEDPNRLHYEPSELKVFENIECQWPLFFAFFILEGLFRNDRKQVEEYRQKLDEVMLKTDDGIPYLPELYYVPADKVDAEYQNPKSQKRLPGGKMPHMWGQSMYILGRLVYEGFLSPGELDPLNKRLVLESKPDIVVQVVILAEDSIVQDRLAEHGIEISTVSQVAPIKVYPAHVLSQIYSLLGKNKRLGLTGRPSNEIGILATSKLYSLQDQILAFIPQFLGIQRFYIAEDLTESISLMHDEIGLLKDQWKAIGRPTVTFTLSKRVLDNGCIPPPVLIATIKKLQTGYINGTRVEMGKLSDFQTTSCVTNLSFIIDRDDPNQAEDQVMCFIDNITSPTCPRPHLLSNSSKKKRKPSRSQRSMSVHGIVRRSRSIQIDRDQLQDINFLDPTVAPAVEVHHVEHLRSRAGYSSQSSPEPSPKVHRKGLTAHDSDVDINELIENLQQTESLQEQADIIHYLFVTKGADWDTTLGGQSCTVKELLTELYEKAGHWHQWWLVRHTAGMLKKRVEDLALAATDLLVRQKQLSVGMPPDGEKIITSPLPPDELSAIIYNACGEDTSTASLTQELLIYLAMFIRTEPKLFHEMLRLRVGLIIQVMASELVRTLNCSADEASDHLLNLSPFEMKTLLHHILSGKEFVINKVQTEFREDRRLSVHSKHCRDEMKAFARRGSKGFGQREYLLDEENDDMADRQGQWLRRRRLDGALNRVPVGFYPRVWRVLERCQGLSIKGYVLYKSLTQEMTSGEFKFAMQVEMVLNRIPQPEYRQLMVEALMVLSLLVETDGLHVNMSQIIEVDRLVNDANNLFIEDQKMPREAINTSTGVAGINQHFYDNAPSGRYGTMSYLCRALAKMMNLSASATDNVDCVVS